MSGPAEEEPTAVWPVAPAPEPMGDGDDEGVVEDEWTEPRRRSRATIVLVMVLLVALGFLAGVFVGRAGATSGTPGGGAPAATSSARPAP